MADPSDEEDAELHRNRRSLFLSIAGAVVLLSPLAALGLKDLFFSSPGHHGSIFGRNPFHASLPPAVPAAASGGGLAASPPAPAQPEPEPPAKAEPKPQEPPIQAPPAPESSQLQASQPAPQKAGPKPFRPPSLRPIDWTSSDTSGSIAQGASLGAGQTAQKNAPSPQPQAPAAPVAQVETPNAPTTQAETKAVVAAPSAPKRKGRRIVPPPADSGPGLAAPADSAQHFEEASVAPTLEAPAPSPSPASGGDHSVFVGNADTIPPPSPERPRLATDPCPHASWWKNSATLMCYYSKTSCLGASNGRGNCTQGR